MTPNKNAKICVRFDSRLLYGGCENFTKELHGIFQSYYIGMCVLSTSRNLYQCHRSSLYWPKLTVMNLLNCLWLRVHCIPSTHGRKLEDAPRNNGRVLLMKDTLTSMLVAVKQVGQRTLKKPENQWSYPKVPSDAWAESIIHTCCICGSICPSTCPCNLMYMYVICTKHVIWICNMWVVRCDMWYVICDM